ncbi:Lysin motif, partial [Rhizoctonia solani]
MHARISTSPGPSTFSKSNNYKLPSSPVPTRDVLAPDSYATAIGGREARRRLGSTDDVGPTTTKSGLRARSRSHSIHENGNGSGNSQTHPLQANGNDRGADTRPVLRRMLSSKDGKAKGGVWGFSDGWVEEEDEEEGQKETRPTGTFREMLVHKVQPKDSLAGVALKYGVSIADVRKVNKLWTADSIHLRSILYIPLTASVKLDLIDLTTPGQEGDPPLPSDQASSNTDDASKSNASDSPAPDSHRPTIQHVPISQLSFFPPPSMSPRKSRTMPRSVSSPFASNPPLLFTPGLSSASLMNSPFFSTSSPQLSSSPNKGVGSLSSLLSALPLPDAVQRLSIDSIAGGALTPRTSTPDPSEQFVELNPMGSHSSPGAKPKRTIKTQPTQGPVMTVPRRSVEIKDGGRTTFATVDDDCLDVAPTLTIEVASVASPDSMTTWELPSLTAKFSLLFLVQPITPYSVEKLWEASLWCSVGLARPSSSSSFSSITPTTSSLAMSSDSNSAESIEWVSPIAGLLHMPSMHQLESNGYPNRALYYLHKRMLEVIIYPESYYNQPWCLQDWSGTPGPSSPLGNDKEGAAAPDGFSEEVDIPKVPDEAKQASSMEEDVVLHNLCVTLVSTEYVTPPTPPMGATPCYTPPEFEGPTFTTHDEHACRIARMVVSSGVTELDNRVIEKMEVELARGNTWPSGRCPCDKSEKKRTLLEEMGMSASDAHRDTKQARRKAKSLMKGATREIVVEVF